MGKSCRAAGWCRGYEAGHGAGMGSRQRNGKVAVEAAGWAEVVRGTSSRLRAAGSGRDQAPPVPQGGNGGERVKLAHWAATSTATSSPRFTSSTWNMGESRNRSLSNTRPSQLLFSQTRYSAG